MIGRPIVIEGILKEEGPGGFGGGTDGGDGQRIAILAGGVEEGITRGSLKRPGCDKLNFKRRKKEKESYI